MPSQENPAAAIGVHFAQLDDPRVERCQRHKLIDILTIGICAVICGSDDYPSIRSFGMAKERWLCTFLELPNGIPSADTFWRVFGAIDPVQFERCFLAWMTSISQVTAGEIIALDGKQLRRSHDQSDGKAAIHMVSAWATTNRLVLGQVQVDEKSNEITAIPELLSRLDVDGCLVTIDAMGCQVEIAEQIVAQGGDYLLALKGNQEQLHEDVQLLFADLAESDYTAYAYDHAKTVEKDHGRLEIRQCWTISDPELLRHLRGAERFAGLHTVIQVCAERRIAGQPSTREVRYYISSASPPAGEALNATRSHWHIENSLHWVLDIAFREDESRLRKNHGAHNFALLRHIALNALKQENSLKLGIKNKRLRAGWDEDYLLKVLSHLAD